MIISSEVIIGFKLPEEHEMSEEFRKENKDFTQSISTRYVSYSKKGMYTLQYRKTEPCLEVTE